MTQKRVRVRGVRREEVDVDKLALAYWLLAKQAVDKKRQRQAADKAVRKEVRS